MFSEETIENWRQERVKRTDLGNFSDTKEHLLATLKVCQEDLKEEEFRFSCLSNSIKESRYNLKCLKKRIEKIQKAIEKLEQ